MPPPLVKLFTKAQIEKRRFTIDYSCWLAETETLSNYTVIVQPLTAEAPLSAFGSYADASSKKLTMFIAGGRIGTTYRIAFVADTNQGQVKRDDIGMKVI